MSTVDPFRPPATSTMFPLSSTAAWLFIGPGIDAVAVQVLVLLNSSAEDSVPLPVDEPPATSTWPWSTMVFGNSVIVAPTRAEVIVPADDQLPFEKPGSKTIADDCTADPFSPPAIRIFPFVFCSVDGMCCSRGDEMEASVLNAFCTGSNRYTAAIVDVPLLPPTSSTWLLSWLFVVSISVAV